MQSRHLIGSFFLSNQSKFEEIIQSHHKQKKGTPLPHGNLLFSNNACRHYYITDTVMNAVADIDVRSASDLSWVTAKLSNCTKQWSWKRSMMRFTIQGHQLILLYLAPATRIEENLLCYNEGIGYNYVIVTYDLTEGTATHFEGDVTTPLFEEAAKQFFQLLIFTLLAPIEEHIVPAKTKLGTRKSAERLLNKEATPITVININWNRVSIRTTGFSVKGKSGIGFLRKQACGPGMKHHEWTWIEPFEKHGYVRTATKTKEP